MVTQANTDEAAGQSVVSIPEASAGQETVVEAATQNVFAQMDGDRKTTALKRLQVRGEALLLLVLS